MVPPGTGTLVFWVMVTAMSAKRSAVAEASTLVAAVGGLLRGRGVGRRGGRANDRAGVAGRRGCRTACPAGRDGHRDEAGAGGDGHHVDDAVGRVRAVGRDGLREGERVASLNTGARA